MSDEPRGTIHDLGYQRYAGVRSAPATRWRSIARQQLALAWKTWWRYKAALGLAVIVTFIAGGVMFLLSDRAVKGVILPTGVAATLTDAALPRSIAWYCRVAFLVSLTIGARTVAGDMQSGAFTFYFARSVRVRDYLVGKLVGLVVLVGAILIAGPLVLALARLGLSGSLDELRQTLPLIPKVLLLGLLGTLAYAAVPLGFSALIPNTRYATALWAAYYLIFGAMVWQLSRVFDNGIAALDLATALEAVAFELFDMNLMWGRAKRVEPSAAVISLLVHAAAGIAVVAWQVRRAQHRGIGGGG